MTLAGQWLSVTLGSNFWEDASINGWRPAHNQKAEDGATFFRCGPNAILKCEGRWLTSCISPVLHQDHPPPPRAEDGGMQGAYTLHGFSTRTFGLLPESVELGEEWIPKPPHSYVFSPCQVAPMWSPAATGYRAAHTRGSSVAHRLQVWSTLLGSRSSL